MTGIIAGVSFPDIVVTAYAAVSGLIAKSVNSQSKSHSGNRNGVTLGNAVEISLGRG